MAHGGEMQAAIDGHHRLCQCNSCYCHRVVNKLPEPEDAEVVVTEEMLDAAFRALKENDPQPITWPEIMAAAYRAMRPLEPG